jgi:hypothetical protein
MNIREQLNRQRVKHIVSSYQLDGCAFSEDHRPENSCEESCGGSHEGHHDHRFDSYLEELLQHYPHALIELALVETLMDQWLTVPLLRGIEFLAQTHHKLQNWQHQPIVSTITPEQFQQIVGLDPSPIFGPTELPPSPTVRL